MKTTLRLNCVEEPETTFGTLSHRNGYSAV